MSNFAEFLNHEAFQAKAPALAPTGEYPGVITNWKADTNRNGKTYVQIVIQPTGWPDDLSEEDRAGVSIENKKFTRDFYVRAGDVNSFFYLDQLLASCGIKQGGQYPELLPMLQGAHVVFEIKMREYVDKEGKPRQTNEVGYVKGV